MSENSTNRVTAPSLTRYPHAEPSKNRNGIISWLRGDRVMVWTVALLLGHAIARIINALMSDILEPAFNRAFGDPDNERPETTIFGAKIKVRHFIMAIVQFIIIISIAYALSGSGRVDPSHYQPLDT